MTPQQLENRLTKIEQRNQRVEADKSWETSWTRRLVIAVVTYVIAGIWLMLIHDSMPWLKAFIPAVGFILSTFVLPFCKKWWTTAVYQQRK